MTQDSFVALSATRLAASPIGSQWTLLSHLEGIGFRRHRCSLVIRVRGRLADFSSGDTFGSSCYRNAIIQYMQVYTEAPWLE